MKFCIDPLEMVIQVVLDNKMIFILFFGVKTPPDGGSENWLILRGGQNIFCHKTQVYCIQNDRTDNTKSRTKTEIEKVQGG